MRPHPPTVYSEEVPPPRLTFPFPLLDRHNKCVADVLKHFMGLCAAATQPIDDHYTTEVAILNSMKMENESSALVRPSDPALSGTLRNAC